MAKSITVKLGFLCFVFLDVLLLFMADDQCKVHHYEFFLKETNFTKLCRTKTMLTVNDSFPGPVITVHKGDLVYFNIHNQAKYGVTIHWHGVKQPRNPWSDGPENITQCPIQAGTNFTQEIILSDEEGTLWWHAHSDWSRATVHGAFVILPPHVNYPFPTPDFQQIIVLGSWYRGDVMAIYEEAIETGGNPNISDAHTINGFTGNSTDCPTGETFRMKVTSGKTYLLRIVNAVMNEEQFFGIAKHNLTLVGMDGAYTQPLTTNYLMVTPGQTMDVLFTANQTPTRYYMVSTPFSDGFAEVDNTTAKGIIEYLGDYTPSSTIISLNLPELNNTTAAFHFTAALKSLATSEHPINVPKDITRHIFIAISLNVLPCPTGKFCKGPSVDDNQTILAASLNNVSFSTPKVDILEAYYRNINNIYTEDFPNSLEVFNYTGDVTNISQYTTRGTKVIMLNYGEAVEIVLQGTAIFSPENHPMHLHGFSFYVVGIGSGNFDNSSNPHHYNLENPPRVNTIGVPKSGWVAIRFFANNPGVWFMHCHLERHASWGMDTVFIVKNGCTPQTSIRKPPAYMPPCFAS
ncbi:hypothetical protein MANES_18G108500v8 [Manihot esculenta]|uniref:Uncharacterized protein n=2 Tax=Manihot esculenta TaxID=3983 RepID=A0ACB7FZS3_MANES|nr:hypothetical protein MANES_18G108500v8 [Manihot esculenta]